MSGQSETPSDPYQKMEETLETFLKRADLEPAEKQAWLRRLHESAQQQFTLDNGRIWHTGNIMIPVSLAAFGALGSIPHPTWPHVLMLALPSTGLMFVWVIIAENHRAFQQASAKSLSVIEKCAHVTIVRGKLPGNEPMAKLLTGGATVRNMRYGLLLGTGLAWIGVLILAVRGLL